MTVSPKKRLVLGIDPGFNGALVVLDVDGPRLVHYIDMPSLFTRTGKRYLDLEKISDFLDLWKGAVKFAMLENVHSMPNDGGRQAFSFGEQKGSLTALLSAMKIECRQTPPSVWKPAMGLLSASKSEARKLAMKLIPESRVYFIRARDEGRAEAALMALFGKRIC